jgi:DNA-directed RNA polymerase subunit N (RpoN/RPB10)
MNEPTIEPAPLCFSCGNALPEHDYDLYHKLLQNKIRSGLEEDAARKIILDGELSKVYQRNCCRIMFIGDPIEYRRGMALYEKGKLTKFT